MRIFEYLDDYQLRLLSGGGSLFPTDEWKPKSLVLMGGDGGGDGGGGDGGDGAYLARGKKWSPGAPACNHCEGWALTAIDPIVTYPLGDEWFAA
jgi:hypothetical protein